MNRYDYDAFGDLLPRAVASGQDRKNDAMLKVLASGAALLCSGGVYVGAVRPKDMSGLLTSYDTPAGVVSDPARLQRFGYVSESPVEITDPA